MQQHNAHFSDDILASILNEPIKGNCYFWSAPDQPFVLPARILNFDSVGTDIPDVQHLLSSLDIRAGRFQGEERQAESKLAEIVYRTVTSTKAEGGIEFYRLSEYPSEEKMIACYRPRLSAQVAEKLDSDARKKFCTLNDTYVEDQYLEKALKGSGIVDGIQKVRATRDSDNKSGEFYLIPYAVFDKEPEISGSLVQIDKMD